MSEIHVQLCYEVGNQISDLQQKSGILIQIQNFLKPKFHYADFATKYATSSWQSLGHKSGKSAWFVSWTVMICVRDFVANISTCQGGLHPQLSW